MALKFVDKVRKQTAAAREQILNEVEAKQKEVTQQDAVLQQKMKECANGEADKCRSEVMDAAKQGKTEVSHYIMRYERDPNQRWAMYLARHTKELLEKEGFAVTLVHTKDVPTGSDPMFPYTIYGLYLKINWQ